MNVQSSDVVVTGGASGLGAATSRALAKAGARVTILDQNAESGRVLATELNGLFFQVDVADGPAVEAVFDDLPDLRALVCCAGIGGGRSVVRRNGPHDLESFENMIRVNLVGTFNCLRLAAWRMHTLEPNENGERGVIVTTSSIAAFDGVDGGAAYSASKAGVAGMTLPLARDLGRYGIRVVSIAPGPFATPMTSNMPNSFDQKMIDDSPFPPRMGRPEEYASLAMHLIDNPMMNGEVIRIDAGMRMNPSSLR